MIDKSPPDEYLWTEEREVPGGQVVERVRELVAAGNVRRLVLRDMNDRVLLDLPLFAGVAVGGAMALYTPPLALLSTVAALLARVKLEIVRVHTMASPEHEPTTKLLTKAPNIVLGKEIDQQIVIESVGDDTFPISNRHGSDVLKSEHEIVKTVIHEMTWTPLLADDQSLSQAQHNALGAHLAERLTAETGIAFAIPMTYRFTIQCSVNPGDAVTYRVLWKRRIRTGTWLIAVDESSLSLSYRASLDLSYEIATTPMP